LLIAVGIGKWAGAAQPKCEDAREKQDHEKMREERGNERERELPSFAGARRNDAGPAHSQRASR
jgi:hypothetical protein